MIPPFPGEFLTGCYDDVPAWPGDQITQDRSFDVNRFHGGANEKSKNSLRREKGKRAGRGRPALPLVGPILGMSNQSRSHRIHLNIFCLFRGRVHVPQSMIKEISLPLNPALLCQPAFERGNHLCHRHGTWEPEQTMKVIRHRQGQMAADVSIGFADRKGFLNGLPDLGSCELVGGAWSATDRDEIDFNFGVGRIYRPAIVRKMFATDVVHVENGRAAPARAAHSSAAWRCGCEVKEKSKNSLRREKGKRAGRGRPALPVGR